MPETKPGHMSSIHMPILVPQHPQNGNRKLPAARVVQPYAAGVCQHQRRPGIF